MAIKGTHAAVAAVIAIIGGLLWLLARGPEPGPEKQIQMLIEGAIDDAEDGDVGALMDRVGNSYQGEGGDRDELRSYLTALLFRGGIDVKMLKQTITVTGDTARADVEVVLVRGGVRGAAQGDIGARSVHLDLAREDGEWKVTASQAD
jgi:SnoaL-like domain